MLKFAAGYINFDEYMALVTKKPQLLEFMTSADHPLPSTSQRHPTTTHPPVHPHSYVGNTKIACSHTVPLFCCSTKLERHHLLIPLLAAAVAVAAAALLW